MSPSSSPRRRILAHSPFKPQPTEEVPTFEVDDRVTHDRYGVGRVSSVNASEVTVDFGENKVRVRTPYAKLFKI
ncbi:MAG TPA: hypothetical protein VF635_01105 [Propionibacteriaceae bacterium]|jgi:hypothetical protein